MKRVWLAVSAMGLVAAMGLAASNEVTSVNIVGYNTAVRPVGGQFNLVGVQFNAFDPTLLGIFSTNQLKAGVVSAQADTLFIYDPSLPGYNRYAMKKSDMQFHNPTDWGGPATNPVVPAGTAIWIKSATGTTSNLITIAGEAVDADQVATDIVSGFQLLAYPFSCEIDLNNTGLATNGHAGPVAATGDRVFVWNGTGYDRYALRNTTPPTFRVPTDWGTPTAAIVPLGAAFWYQTSYPFTWTEDNPYKNAFE